MGSTLFEDLGAVPKRAILDALDRTIAGAIGAKIWKSPAARHDTTAERHQVPAR